ncbi:MAG: serine/threonine-protein kinase [Chthoniobacteraceae bacterium]
MPDSQPPRDHRGLDPGELLARALHSVQPTSGASTWLPPAPEELARLLPQYRIESLLGHGGMGAVYKGTQVALERTVAIKLLPAEVAADEQFVARFQREARTLAKLQHPGIVTVYDFGQTSEGHLYFVMEYVDGTDLHRVLHTSGLDPAQALEIIGQVCTALHYAHSQGVIHRDIKPANILLTRDGQAKLADFGLARPAHEGEVSALTSTNVVMGTPDYMAPEQRRGLGDHRADIYALGVMLYEMLTGETPRGIFERPSNKVRVDVRIDEVVIRALQSEPDRRYQRVSEMKTDVDRIRTPVPARVVPPPAPAGAASSLARTVTIAAVITVLLGIIATLVWKMENPSAPTDRVVHGETPAAEPLPLDASVTGTGSEKAVTLTPGEWFKIDLSTTPAPGLSTDGKVQSNSLILQNQNAHLLVPSMRDGALRLRVRQVPKALRFSVRSLDGTGLSVVVDGVRLNVFKPDGTSYGGAYGDRPLQLPADGADLTLQFAHIGGRYVICLGEKNVASGTIAIDPPHGTPELRAEAAEITSLEVIDLDNVPPERWPEFARPEPIAIATPPMPTPLSVVVQSPPPATPQPATPAPASSLLPAFSKQIPNITAWVLAPLDQSVPADIRQNLTFLREDLADESRRQPAASADAYRLGAQLCQSLLAILDERTQTQARAGFRGVEAAARTGVTSQALEARRNYMMSWPQYARETSQRAELKSQAINNAAIMAERPKLEWSQRTSQLSKGLDNLYAQFRAALRQSPASK